MRIAMIVFVSMLALSSSTAAHAQFGYLKDVDPARVQAFEKRAEPLGADLGTLFAEPWEISVAYAPAYSSKTDGLEPRIVVFVRNDVPCDKRVLAFDYCGLKQSNYVRSDVTYLIDAIDQARLQLASATPLSIMLTRPHPCSETGGAVIPSGYVRVDPSAQRVRIHLGGSEVLTFDAAKLNVFRAMLVAAREMVDHRRADVDAINRALPPSEASAAMPRVVC